MSCTLKKWKNAFVVAIVYSLMISLAGCGDLTANPSYDENANNTQESETPMITLSEDEKELIQLAYGEMTEEEWNTLLTDLSQLTTEEFEEWLVVMTDYTKNHNNDEYLALSQCSGYYGSRIGYGWFDYSDSSNYSHLWSTNCYFWNANQCGNDLVVSFWMGPDYRRNQSLLKAYASSSTARSYLKYWEGGYSGDIYQGGSYYNAYMCWPWQLYYSKEQAQLKQLR